MPEPEFHMHLPDSTTYKDLHSGVQSSLPSLTQEHVDNFFSCCGKAWDKKFEAMYTERYIKYIRGSLESRSQPFFTAAVWAEMKKTVSYCVDILVDENGVIVQTQCECAVGQGPSAHCKHVGCVLFGLCQFKMNGETITEQTCTQVLQTFHQAKPHRGSPVRAKDFCHLRKRKPLLYDPRPSSRRKLPGKRDDLRNRFMNFQASVRRPVMTLFPPADMRALASDHDYMAASLEDDFLRREGLLEISEDAIQKIEEVTRDQNRSEIWAYERATRITASNFGAICKATERRNIETLVNALICPPAIKSDAIIHGRKYESVARDRFMAETGLTILKCGLFISKEYPMLAASPDGLIDSETLVEIKCPFSAFNHEASPENVDYLLCDDSGALCLKNNHQYFYQIQGQLFCSGRKFCKFIVYTSKGIKVVDVQYDAPFVEHMLHKLISFYDKHFRPAIIEKFLYKKTSTYAHCHSPH